MFEHKTDPIIAAPAFAGRILVWLFITVALFAFSPFLGMLGYHFLENMSWTDAFLNSAMLLGGMGQVSGVTTEGGKIFAGIYSIYCGVFLIVCSGLLLMPVFHRVLHRFHADNAESDE
jgi:hypothetical protein